MFKAILESDGHEIPPTFSCGIIHAEEFFFRLTVYYWKKSISHRILKFPACSVEMELFHRLMYKFNV